MNLDNVSLIKLGNGSEVSFMKLNGCIVYEKNALPLYNYGEFFFNETITEVETRINSTHTSLNSMFIQCFNLQTVNITGWNKNNGRVTNMYMMFYICRSLTTVNTADFDVSGVKDMASMFSGCISLTSLDLSNWDISDATDTGKMFYNCNALCELRLDNCNYTTIKKIVNLSSLPTGTIDGATRKIYCKQENAPDEAYLPNGWEFIYVS